MYSAIVPMAQIVVGSVACLAVSAFFTLSIPVFLFRMFAVFLAKNYRPDLGDILEGQSAIFAVDYFADTPPRSNVIAKLTFEGELTYDLVKERVQAHWLSSGDARFDRLQERPIKWMGFTFWENVRDTFSLDKHLHKISTTDEEPLNAEQVTGIMEKLLNRRISRDQSPWALYVIESYCSPHLPGSDGVCGTKKKQSVLLFNYHHCLADATGVFMSIVDGLFEGYSFSKMGRAPPQKKKRTIWQKLWFLLTFPINAFLETSYILSYYVRSSPLSIPDSKKEWHQVLSTMDQVVPVQLIKDIKNHFGASYTSVMLSAISGAVHRLQDELRQKTGLVADSMLCLSMLPAKGISSRQIFENHMTGAVFDFPTGSYGTPLERLEMVDKILEKNRNSVVPYLAQFLTTFCGAHLFTFNKLLSKNRLIPISLSNFAGLPEPIKFTNNVHWIFMDGITGCFDGETGLLVMCCSLGNYTGICLAAEKGLLSRAQVQQLVKYILEELHLLEELMVRERGNL